jgi:hypothetical protein
MSGGRAGAGLRRPTLPRLRGHRQRCTSWDAIAQEMTAALEIPDDVTPIQRQTLQKWFKE